MPLPALTLLLACQLVFAPPGWTQTDTEGLARRLLNSQGCKACHSFENTVASNGPDLNKVGSRLTREQLRGTLVNPRHRHANARIADFSHLQEQEIEALTDFLSRRQ
jgi:cytochrome c2